jgi:hypothetical protein
MYLRKVSKISWKVRFVRLGLFKLIRRLFGQLVKWVSQSDWNNEQLCKNLIGFANDFCLYNGHSISVRKTGVESYHDE